MTDQSGEQPRFPLLMRILHWLMAAMVLSMLFIGMAMVSSLGILILLLVVIRFINRKLSKLPPFPPTMSRAERRIAHISEIMLYTLMFSLPLVGWAMLSAGDYPIVMVGPIHLPQILPANPALFAVLRMTHTILAYLLLLTFLGHLSAVLLHTLVLQDGLLRRMWVWKTPSK